MRMHAAWLALVLIGCGGEDDLEATAPAGPTTAGSQATIAATAASLESATDPWADIADALGSVGDGKVAEDVNKQLEKRALRRALEQGRIERAQMDLLASLATSCTDPSQRAAFDTFSAVESDSLAADRETLQAILTAAGAEGRTRVWALSEPATMLIQSRSQMAENLSRRLPSLPGSEGESEKVAPGTKSQGTSDKDIQIRRVLVGLKLFVEATRLEAESGLAEFRSTFSDIDPAAEDAPAKVAEAMGKVDTSLLGGQRAKFDKLPSACNAMSAENWLMMLDQGHLRGFIGLLGGESGVEEDAELAAATAKAGPGMQAGMGQGGPMPQEGMGGQAGGAPGGMGGQAGGVQGGMGGQAGGMQGGMGGQAGGMGGQQGGMGGQAGGMQGGMGGQAGGMGGQQGGVQGAGMGGQQGGMGGQQGGMGGQQGGMGGQQGGMGGQQGGMGGQQGGMGGGMGGQQGGAPATQGGGGQGGPPPTQGGGQGGPR